MDPSASSPPPLPTTTTSRIQKVTKASSDELLRKFAELDSDPPPKSLIKRVHLLPNRRKLTSRRALPISSSKEISTRRTSGGADWNNALLATPSRMPSKRVAIRAREFIGISYVLEAIERTLRRTIEGASRALVERHSNSHVRLISDAV